jgi:chromosome segregation ATPase
MGNEEFRRNKFSDQQKPVGSSESTDSETLSKINDHSKEIQKLQEQILQLQDQLTKFQVESQERENKLKMELSETKSSLGEKTQSVTILMNELDQKKVELINLEERLNHYKSESQKQLQERSEQIVTMELEIQEMKNNLTTAKEKIQEYEKKIQKSQSTISGLQSEKEAFLNQISKMQDLIQQTEEEIKEIEASHLEVQDQLKLEIKRMEDRTGQMREDLARESTGTLARDRHIRVVLQQSELGRTLLYLVDYFENTKKRYLLLDTLSTEVGIPPIICRTHLRHLHELAVCEFNEVTREIRLTKRAK